MNTILVPKHDFKEELNNIQEKYKNSFGSLEFMIEQNFRNQTDRNILKRDLKNTFSIFISSYNVIKKNKEFNNLVTESNKIQSATNIASEITLRYVLDTFQLNQTSDFLFPDLNLNKIKFLTDQTTINTTLLQLEETVQKNTSINHNEISKEYFHFIEQQTQEQLNEFILNKVLNLKIEFAETFSFRFGESILEQQIKSETQNKQKYRIQNKTEESKKLREYNFNPVLSIDEIRGNPDKFKVEEAVQQLMLYDSKEQRNPCMEDGEFSQHIILAGEPGCGKTMIANYAATLAKKIGKQITQTVDVVELDISSTYQMGPVKLLEEQLRAVAEKNNPVIIVVNEADTKFPSRINESGQYSKELNGELFRFTGGEYTQKGNYLMLFTMNDPSTFDPAIHSRCGEAIYRCKGPETPEDRAIVLEHLLHKGIKAGYVQIENFSKIGMYATELNLSGRDLKNVSKTLLNNRNINYEELYAKKFEDKLKGLQKSHEIIQDNKVYETMYNISQAKANANKNYLKEENGISRN